MSRKIVRLTLDHLAALDPPCRGCLFWELDPVMRRRVPPAEAVAEKEQHLSEVLREWGSCGRVALVDDTPVGYVVYAPAAYFPGAAAFPTAPVSPDAVLLTTAYVAPTAEGGGLGRMLIQGMARDLITRGGIRAVEAFGDARSARARSASGVIGAGPGCVPATEFLSSVGFKTQRSHPITPRMRMDLRSALTWRDEWELALDRLVGVVRPGPRPVAGPTPREIRRDGAL
ncbi:GNAT family N-acetyltransferase [Nocardioides pacificus]